MAQENHWLPGFNFSVEEWFEGDHYETLGKIGGRLLVRFARRPPISAYQWFDAGVLRTQRPWPLAFEARHCATVS
jgi:hypothetical protein